MDEKFLVVEFYNVVYVLDSEMICEVVYIVFGLCVLSEYRWNRLRYHIIYVIDDFADVEISIYSKVENVGINIDAVFFFIIYS